MRKGTGPSTHGLAGRHRVWAVYQTLTLLNFPQLLLILGRHRVWAVYQTLTSRWKRMKGATVVIGSWYRLISTE